MHYHIILTELCNKQCKYCYEKSMRAAEFDNLDKNKLEFDKTPVKSEVDLDALDKFLNHGDSLIFYGGEPLVEIEKIKEIIDKLKNKQIKFRMQTNSMLLNQLDSSYLNKIDKILISIDGNKQRTDFNRGDGTYDKIIENIKLIKKNNYSGELIARMTISQDFPDVYEQILHLIDLIEQELFDSIHWQIDAGFYKSDFSEEEFSRFVNEYNKSIKKLIDYWISEMKKGRVIRLYPFIGIVKSILNNEKTKMRCGAGHSGFAITTNGMISSCPVTNGVKTFYVGNIDKINNKEEKIKQMNIKGKCIKCNYLDLCGGRCLYQNYAQLWPEKGNDLICKTIKYLIEELKKATPEIKLLIKEKKIKKSDFDYEKYFGPEIIP